MPKYGAFLRAMNIGGRRVTNSELCDAFESMGLHRASGFLASGNVLFESTSRSTVKLERRIEQGLGERLGYDVPTFVRDAATIRAIAIKQPFPEPALAASAGNTQVVMLTAQPSAADRNAALALATDDDLLAFADSELYWLPKKNISESKLNVKAVERVLGSMTIRTHRTVVRLAAKFA